MKKFAISLFVSVQLVFSFSLFAVETSSQAGPFDKYKEMVRPYVEKYLSVQFADKVFGKKSVSHSLPTLPKLDGDVKTLRSVDETKVGKNIADPKVNEKYNYLFLTELFQTVRDEKITADVMATWMNSLSQGGSREGVYQAIVLDNIYGGMENRDYPVNDGVINFTIIYMPRFLGTNVSAKGLEGVNFYRLKREVTNLSLSMMDALASTNVEDFYQWYAVFSAELAQQYPQAMNNSARTNQDLNFHLKWVQSVPYQHSKSEVMVKLQLVFNSLY